MNNKPEYLDHSIYEADVGSLPMTSKAHTEAMNIIEEKMIDAKQWMMKQPLLNYPKVSFISEQIDECVNYVNRLHSSTWLYDLQNKNIPDLMYMARRWTWLTVKKIKAKALVKKSHNRIATLKKQLVGAKKKLKKVEDDVNQWDLLFPHILDEPTTLDSE